MPLTSGIPVDPIEAPVAFVPAVCVVSAPRVTAGTFYPGSGVSHAASVRSGWFYYEYFSGREELSPLSWGKAFVIGKLFTLAITYKP